MQIGLSSPLLSMGQQKVEAQKKEGENPKKEKKPKRAKTSLLGVKGDLQMSWLVTVHGGELLAVARGSRVALFSQKITKVMKMHEFDLEWFEFDSGEFPIVTGSTCASLPAQNSLSSSSSTLSASGAWVGSGSPPSCSLSWTHNSLLLVSSSSYINVYTKWQASVGRMFFFFFLIPSRVNSFFLSSLSPPSDHPISAGLSTNSLFFSATSRHQLLPEYHPRILVECLMAGNFDRVGVTLRHLYDGTALSCSLSPFYWAPSSYSYLLLFSLCYLTFYRN
jgi:hypothetical protein